MSTSGAPLVVGFDLDMTLIDTRPGAEATFDALAEDLGVEIPAHRLAQQLGPPLDQMLAGHVPAERMSAAIDRFRELYVDHAVAAVPVLPGAHEALAAVRAHGGRVVVVTGKYARNAERHVAHLGLDVDVVVGEVWGRLKGPALAGHGARMYVGDHVHDVEAARAGGVLSVSVPSGPCSAAELLAAGTDVVLDDLTLFPSWLDGAATV